MMLSPARRNSGRNNEEMVDRFVEAGLISSKEVEDTFRAVPRGAFVPSEQFDEAYFDSPLRGDPHVHMSAPHMYATILEALDLCPGLSFLNIGSGTGYFSCLVGYIIKRSSVNHGIEHYEDLVEYCKERCDEFMRYNPAVANEMSQPVFLAGNCFRLDNKDRQYDRIYCGAACPPNKVPFILSMTRVGGFAIIPCKNKLLKIDRVSPTGVKQSVIREVSFASLTALPTSEESLPKLKFPPSGDRKKQKTLKVHPPSDLLISNGASRKTLAKLRALQEVCECLQSSEPLPLPFCYIPDQEQLKELKASKKIKESPKPREVHLPSAVDSKIAFFASWSGQTPSLGTDIPDKWDFINSDKLWEKVVEHYYSVCSVSIEEKMKAMLLYVRKKAKKHSAIQNPSYAELMTRIGLPVDSLSQSSCSKKVGVKESHESKSHDDNCSVQTNECLPSSKHKQAVNTDHATASVDKPDKSKGDDFNNISGQTTKGLPPSEHKQAVNADHATGSVDKPSTLSGDERKGEDCNNSNGQTTKGLPSVNADHATGSVDKPNTCSSDETKGDDCNNSSGQSNKNVSSSDPAKFSHHENESEQSTVLSPNSKEENCDNSSGETSLLSNNQTEGSSLATADNETISEDKQRTVLNAESKEGNCDVCVEKEKHSKIPASLVCVAQRTCSETSTTKEASKTPIGINENDTDSKALEEAVCAADRTEEGNDHATGKCAHSKRSSLKEHRKTSEADKKKSEYVDVVLAVDSNAMKKLNSFPKKNWSLEDDRELVHFLTEVSDQSSKGRCKGWFKPELVRPSLFSRIDSLTYPKLSSIPAEDLSYRIVGLCRIASVLDSSLHLLTGSSLLNEYTSMKRKYPMDSFNDASFVSSRKANTVSFETIPAKVKDKPKEETVEYGVMDADQLRVQLELTGKKLKLTQDLQEQIKEQQKVLRKQASLLEEKQLLIQNLSLLDIQRHSERPQTNEQHLVVELKTQRQDVLGKIQKLGDQFALQETKKAELVVELKQVKEERNRVLCMETRKMKTRESSTLVEHQQTEEPSTTQAEHTASLSSKESSRYQISSLLPHLRFLLPLCRQRWRLVQEMLHASECSAPDHLPIVTVDRRIPLCERGGRTDCSVLLQVYKELKPEGLNYRWNKWKYDQWWEVKFVGEGIIDQGGGFRDSLVEIADEICPPEKTCPEVLPFFIKTPNNKDGVGEYQDTYIPTPLSKQWHIYEWIGKLFGAAYRTDENLTVSCPPFFWKLLVGEHVTWARDYADIDLSVVAFTDALEASDEDVYDAAYGVDCTFSTVLSDGSRVELIPGGENIPVKSTDRTRFTALLREARMTEFVKQVLAIRKGLISVVPESVLRLLTWDELERGVCGNPDVSLSILKNSCKYGDDLSESTDCIKHLWSALSKFTNDERSKFLRFVTGRRRPPAPFTVVKAGGSHELPNASTCASSLFWPNYPSATVATARLRYAIYNCIAIDTDTSPW